MAAIIVGLDDLSKSLIEAGTNLLLSHSSTDQLLALLHVTECLLRKVEQDQPLPMQNALIPSKKALVSFDLLNHPDSDVRVSVVSCLTEIVRINAPEAPYSDDQMKEIFKMTVEAFEKLADTSSLSYSKAESVLDNVAKVKSCLVMLDLECYDLVLQMFRTFLKIIRSDHPQMVFSSMEIIMITIIDEIEEVSTSLLDVLLASVRKENQNASPMSWSLVEKVLSRCTHKLKPYIIRALNSTGASLDMYSPVVSAVWHSVPDTTKVNTKENEAAAAKLGRQVAPSDSFKENLELGHSRKEIRSKSSSKRLLRVNENDKVNRNNLNLLKESLKQVWPESTNAETELGVTGKRGRKPNSLMNPEEGYDISLLYGKKDSLKTSYGKKIQKKRYGGESSLGKVAAKKTPLPKETSPATSRALTGSLKRSLVQMDDSDHDLDSLSSPRLKKLASCFRDEEALGKESNQESFGKPEDDIKIGNSSKKNNGLEKSQKTAKKKPIVDSSRKRSSARSEAKRKRMVSQLADESEETSKSHLKRRRSERKEVESDTNVFGEDLIGTRVNMWWPLDETYYEGVVDSYCSRKKKHRIVYTDGDAEEVNLSEERWEIIEDQICGSEDKEIDLPESIPLSDLMQKVKKSKTVAVSVEPSSSLSVRSSSRTVVTRNKSGRNGAVGKNLKSLKELNAETERVEEQEVSGDAESNRTEEHDYEGDGSEEQEESENKGVEAETKEEEKECPNSEVESEREKSESDEEEEPKWRETDDMEDEAEVDEIEKQEDKD